MIRPFEPRLGERFLGNAIAYGPYRDGQFPGGPQPTREQLREDLGILARHWGLLRTYGAAGPTGTVLELIREEGLPLRVMLGAWIGRDEDANRAEVDAAIRLANAYPDVVIALCVGNETQVSWSAHRIDPGLLVPHLRRARAATRVPVATADDYNFWNKPESRAVADEVDLVVLHAHPLWNGRQLEEALPWTQETFASIVRAHPDRPVVLGETGWATRKHDEGEQARLIRGTPGEEEQARFHRAVVDWVERERVVCFFFEAFDENWKGGPHPAEVEKHWGLYRADRTPKRALAGPP